MSNIADVTMNMEECKSIGVKVLGPDVNESFYKFAVNKKGEIRFGLGAVKGVGEAAVHAIVKERKENGNYISLEDFVSRVNLKAANKKTLESIALSGGFDSFNLLRSQLFYNVDGMSYLEKMTKFGNKLQSEKDSTQIDMFGEIGESSIQAPIPAIIEPWGTMELLSKEKEVVGVYISGHPLDDYRLEIDNFVNASFDLLKNMNEVKGKDMRFAAVVTAVEHRESKTGKKFGIVYLEDYRDSFRLFLFGSDYTDYKNFLTEGWVLFVRGRVQNRQWGNTDDLEFKISKIEMLDQLIDSENRCMMIEIPYDIVNDNMINHLLEVVNENKGDHTLKVKLINYKDRYAVELLSRTSKVDLNKSLMDELNKINDLKISIQS
jgi:DNA polymerase-3 subunit alpha